MTLDRTSSIFDVSNELALHLRKLYRDINTHQKLKDYLAKLSMILRTRDDVVTHNVTFAGMHQETLYIKLGYVVFALNNNYDANPDGINIELYITPLYYYNPRSIYGVSFMNNLEIITNREIAEESLTDLYNKLNPQ